MTSSFAAEEARRNLTIKFPDAVDALDNFLAVVDIVPVIFNDTCPIELPEKDAPIFLSAVGAGCAHLS